MFQALLTFNKIESQIYGKLYKMGDNKHLTHITNKQTISSLSSSYGHVWLISSPWSQQTLNYEKVIYDLVDLFKHVALFNISTM
jgi:hypothetical protein